MSPSYDAAVIGAGVMGASTALFLARGGMRVVLYDQGPICRAASGVNAGTLTLHMTRADLIPYAMAGFRMWQSTDAWLGDGVDATATDGLCLAFTEGEEELLRERAERRAAAGAPIALIEAERAREIEPGLSPMVRLAAHSPMDGHARAHLTGMAFRSALLAAGVEIREQTKVLGLTAGPNGFLVALADEVTEARRVVLASGAWLQEMLGWFDVAIRVRFLVNQLVVTERLRPVMRSVISIANGLLSLKQFANGTVLIGGGWQGHGTLSEGGTELVQDNLIGNVRLARWAIPALVEARVLRAWLGFEAETEDAMPLLGPVPGAAGAFVIGAVHSGYTSGPFMGHLLAAAMLGREPELPLFDPQRLVRGSVP